jgi:hypothetical protein
MASTQSQSPAASRPLKSALVLLAKLLVSVGLLAWLFSHVDFSRLWHYARHASPSWLLVGLGLYFLTLLVGAWRWGLILSAQSVDVPGTTLVTSYLVATFANNFLPSNIGGDVIRIRDTARPDRPGDRPARAGAGRCRWRVGRGSAGGRAGPACLALGAVGGAAPGDGGLRTGRAGAGRRGPAAATAPRHPPGVGDDQD